MDYHLDGEAAEGSPNSRNGYGRRTLLTEGGKLPISVPRDRLSTFDLHVRWSAGAHVIMRACTSSFYEARSIFAAEPVVH